VETGLPEIARFYGIVIKMFWVDHDPPHIHAEYGDFRALIDISSLAVIGGALPPRALGLTVEWATMHKGELQDLWALARSSQPLHRLDPLP
jgi:hypothetical protein